MRWSSVLMLNNGCSASAARIDARSGSTRLAGAAAVRSARNTLSPGLAPRLK